VKYFEKEVGMRYSGAWNQL